MNIILLIISALIYVSYGIQNFIYILFSLLTSFFVAKHLKGKSGKILLVATIAINAIVLIFVKLLPYTKINIIAPLGISYFTLQVISYLVDVYKEKYEYEKNILNYALYIMYIPHLFIGPITRYNEVKNQINSKRKITINNFLNGSLRICYGLFKKLIIAGRVSIVITLISQNTSTYNGSYALFAMLLYSVLLYTDFSGGIDVVLGISKMLGITLPENFNSPFLAQNIKEFWRRWHISLSAWLKDYIYIPLGGSRCSKLKKSVNVIITFLVSGLWHGINYIVWGILHGIFVIIGDKFNTKSKCFNRTVNFVIISILWSFFIWNNNITALKMIGSVFTEFNMANLCSNFLKLGLSTIDWIIIALSTISVMIFDIRKDKIIKKVKNLKIENRLIIICGLALIILVFGIYGIGFNVNEFIYSKF